MSIAEIMALHPDAGGTASEARAEVARHALLCATMCVSCADACSAETMDMRQCIRVCADCADICMAASRVAVRQTGSNPMALRATLELCAHVCEACAEECERHAHEHCRLCAQTCRECAQDCRNALGTVE